VNTKKMLQAAIIQKGPRKKRTSSVLGRANGEREKKIQLFLLLERLGDRG